MSHETPKLRVVGDAAKSAERLREKLVEALGIIDKARDADGKAQAEGKPGTAWRNLSAAVGALRSLLRPEPGTIAWHTEIDYYLDHEPHLRWDASGEYRTPKDAIDFLTASPSISVAPRATPISPGVPPLLPGGADGAEPGDVGETRHMSNAEAIAILARLAAQRNRTVDEVTALEMGARRMLARVFQKQRNWARRRERSRVPVVPEVPAVPVKAAEPLTPEEELADTIKRQQEESQS